MGSSGSGRISDYPGSSSSSAKAGESGGGGVVGGAEDRCAKAFSARLEDVEQSDYYRTHRSVPPLGIPLTLAQRKRIVAETTSGESVGNLPTSFNYLASCMKHGWTYVGKVQGAVSGPPVAAVSVDFAAIQPK